MAVSESRTTNMAEVVRSANNEQILQEILSHRKDNEQQFQSMNAVFQQSERKYMDQLRETSSRQEKRITQLMDVNRQQTDSIKELTESMFQLYTTTITSRPIQRGASSTEQTSVEEQSRKLVTKTFQRLETNIKHRNSRDDVTKQMLVERELEINKLRRQLENLKGQLENYEVVLKARNSRLEREQKPDSQQTTDASSDEHLARIRRLKTLPEPLFSASCVSAEMFQCGALTMKELEMIRTCRLNRCDIEAAETLLDILEKAPREVFDVFLQALRHTKQEHVYQQIVDQEFTADTGHCRLIREYYLYFLDKLDTKVSLLTVHLYDADVLNLSEKQDIEAELTSTRQNEKLLSVMSHKSVEQWGLFLTALDNTGQWHIVNKLTGRTDTETETITVRCKDVVGQNAELQISECTTLKQQLEQKQMELENREANMKKLRQEFETATNSLREQIRLKDKNETRHLNIIRAMKRSAVQCGNQLNAMRLCLSEIKQTTLRDIGELKEDINIGRQQLEEKGKYLETAIREREAKHHENEIPQKYRKLETLRNECAYEKLKAYKEDVEVNRLCDNTQKQNKQSKVKDDTERLLRDEIVKLEMDANELQTKLKKSKELLMDWEEKSLKCTDELNDVQTELRNIKSELAQKEAELTSMRKVQIENMELNDQVISKELKLKIKTREVEQLEIELQHQKERADREQQRRDAYLGRLQVQQSPSVPSAQGNGVKMSKYVSEDANIYGDISYSRKKSKPTKLLREMVQKIWGPFSHSEAAQPQEMPIESDYASIDDLDCLNGDPSANQDGMEWNGMANPLVTLPCPEYSRQTFLGICGVTQSDNKLFIVYLSNNTIQVMGQNYKQLTDITLTDLIDPTDIVSCAVTQQLYVAGVSRDSTGCVWRVSLDGRQVVKWLPNKSTTTSQFRPYTLSLTSRRLLMTSEVNNELFLYGAGGNELKRVPLPDLKGLRHAVETSHLTFIVCHQLPQPRVCEVNLDGQVTGVYSDQQQLGQPEYLWLDSDGRIFVADHNKQHILLLNSRLELVRVLFGGEQDELTEPWRLCYTEQTRQLIIGGKQSILCSCLL